MANHSVMVNFSNLRERAAAARVNDLHAHCLESLQRLVDPSTSPEQRRKCSEEIWGDIGQLAEHASWLGIAREESDPKYVARLQKGESSPPSLWDVQLTAHVSDLKEEIARAAHGKLTGERLKSLALDAPRKIAEIIDTAIVYGRLEQAQQFLRTNATPIIERGEWARDKHRIRQALCHIDPECVYDEWVQVGMAIHHASGGSEDGFELFHEWSRGGLTQ